MKPLQLLISFLFFQIVAFSQTVQSCVTTDEMKLYDLIMKYRTDNNLPTIPHSKSLSFVADQHTWDLEVNKPENSRCNMHSWSKNSAWTSCCYTPDHKQAECMWNKPKELTTYQGYGFEIACGGTGELSPEAALKCWQGSEHHNDVILNKSIWKDYTWGAIGISMYGSYAVVWFGKEKDDAGEPEICK